MIEEIRTVSIIEGKTHSGKTTQLLNEYREKVKKEKCMILCYEEDLTKRIPLEEVTAHTGCVNFTPDRHESLETFLEEINETINQHDIRHTYIDGLNFVTKKRYDIGEIFTLLHKLNSGVTATMQVRRNAYANYS